MTTACSTRREFLKHSFLAAATAALAEPAWLAAAPAPKLQPIRLGGPSFAKTDDPEELARAIASSAIGPPIARAWRSRTRTASAP